MDGLSSSNRKRSRGGKMGTRTATAKLKLSVKSWVPARVKASSRRSLDLLRSELSYLELHLTDHCNLNCRGCSHYCPVAVPSYADPESYKVDLLRLAQLFHSIRDIRLMGGEPLLHPNPESFIRLTRATFPLSAVTFVTNGTLLPDAPASFWKVCRDTDTSIEVTLYPPFRKLVSVWRALSETQAVRLHITDVRTFDAQHNLKGDSDKSRTFRLCRSRYFCPFLQHGRIHTCAVSALTDRFNASFGTQIAADPGIDIHSPDVSGRTILRYLSRPIETCRWCAEDPVAFRWSTSNRAADEWDAATQRMTVEKESSRTRNVPERFVPAAEHLIRQEGHA